MVSRRVFGLAGALMALAAAPVAGQDTSTNQVAAKTDWSVFEEKSPRECWAVSSPKEILNTKGGNAVAVKRSDILLMAFFRPDAGVSGQITFTGGYSFASGSTVNLSVDGNSFELFTEGEWAWPASPADDAKILTAMKRGSKAVLTARSARGTDTKDTFSLSGFTAAVEDAEKRCK